MYAKRLKGKMMLSVHKKITPESITVELLLLAGLAPTQAKQFLEALRLVTQQFEINTVNRLAAFLGQTMVESTNFTQLEENLYYTTPERIRLVFKSAMISETRAAALVRNPKELANVVYGDRLGNIEPHDGWSFRGSGLIQLTGRYNFMRAGQALNRPYLTDPDLVRRAPDATLTAAWYWQAHECNTFADRWNIAATTKAINPSMYGANQRLAKCNQVKSALMGESHE